jgi:hypothetical protein
MARSSLILPTIDLQSDSGSVLLSLVIGEQLEFPVTLAFIENTSLPYEYEAVLMESLNVLGQTEPPVVSRPGGVNTQLTVWTPPWRASWSASNSYNMDDLVLYNGKYYLLKSYAGYVSTTAPDLDNTHWLEYVPNKVYIRFPKTLTAGWDVGASATTESDIYGLFELRVTEPSGGRYPRTWKPMRGMVAFSYSPTELVA